MQWARYCGAKKGSEHADLLAAGCWRCAGWLSVSGRADVGDSWALGLGRGVGKELVA